MQTPTDTERLDFIERQSQPGSRWACRQSTTGRGFRLHNESYEFDAQGNPTHPTARDAIDAHMDRMSQSRGQAPLFVDPEDFEE